MVFRILAIQFYETKMLKSPIPPHRSPGMTFRDYIAKRIDRAGPDALCLIR
jgi:hypothetical protein